MKDSLESMNTNYLSSKDIMILKKKTLKEIMKI